MCIKPYLLRANASLRYPTPGRAPRRVLETRINTPLVLKTSGGPSWGRGSMRSGVRRNGERRTRVGSDTGWGGNQHHMVRRSQQLQMRWDEGQDDLKPRVYGLFVVSTLAMCKHAGFKPDKRPGSAQLRAHARNPRPDTSAARPGNGAFPTNNSTPKGLRDDEGYPSAPASPRCI